MKSSIYFKDKKSILYSIPILFFIGSLSHFLYDFSGNLLVFALFSPINESIWEHMKLTFYPILFWWSIYYYHQSSKPPKDLWFFSCMISSLSSCLVIPLLYYSYSNAFGLHLLWVDILILFIAILSGQLFALHIFQHSKGLNITISLSVLLFICILFWIFTFFPPSLPLFSDPSATTIN